jgi:PPOX class probable F420-dependent enzyme
LNRLLDWPAGARNLVESLAVGRLATVDSDRHPHVVPICFVVLDDILYSVVDAKPKRRPRDLKRLRNLATHPSASVVIDRYDDDWTRLAWVMLSGCAAVVDDDVEYARAIAALVAKYPQYRDMRFARDTNPLIGLRIERVRFWRSEAPDPTSTR